MVRRPLLLAALACGLGLSACGAESLTGGDDSETKNGKEAVAVVEKFAGASGPEACNLLTPNALRNVYGGEDAVGQPAVPIDAAPPQYAVDNCLEAAPKFEGEKIEIDKVDVIAERAVKVQAAVPGTADDEDRLFDVTLRRKGDVYLIDEVREK
jgi:hypothetical protein